MTSVTMKYGSGTVDVSVPEKNLLGVIEKEAPPAAGSEEEVVRAALADPVGTPPLAELVGPGRTVTVVISDVTRLWQRPFAYLPMLVEELERAGVASGDIRFLIAPGLHRAQTDEEKARLVGPELAGRYEVADHDAWDAESLVDVGRTSRGTPVLINRKAVETDCLVLTGCCTYHPFFGWAGGKKSLLPGIAGFDSVQANHRMVLADEVGAGQRPEARNGNIEGNPVHEDAEEAAALVEPAFLFNVVMGYDGRIAHAFAGHWKQAHDRACRCVADLYGVPVPERAQLTIASQGGYPKDIEFYQTGKAIYNATDSLEPGGTLVVLSECREGLGPEEARAVFQDFDTTEEREKEVRRYFNVPTYVCYYICAAAERFDIIVVSSLDPALLAKTRLRVVPTLEQALDTVYREKGTDLRTYLMPLGSTVLPIVQDA